MVFPSPFYLQFFFFWTVIISVDFCPSVVSHWPGFLLTPADEMDARRKEAIHSKVSQ